MALLLDMSASTSEPVSGKENEECIIDLEKEAAVLMMEALETIGDSYGIYGFSGNGRQNAVFNIIKAFDEPLNDLVKSRLHQIQPLGATRMGVAIRHACTLLATQEARTKVLLLLSDGRPRDQDYGRDNKDQAYALHDTHQALKEARQQGVSPFLITVDTNGDDYLQNLCGNMGYEVISNITTLPGRLAGIYRRITAH